MKEKFTFHQNIFHSYLGNLKKSSTYLRSNLFYKHNVRYELFKNQGNVCPEGKQLEEVMLRE